MQSWFRGSLVFLACNRCSTCLPMMNECKGSAWNGLTRLHARTVINGASCSSNGKWCYRWEIVAGIGSQGCLNDGKTNGLLSFWRVLDRFWKNAKMKFLRMSEFFCVRCVWWLLFVSFFDRKWCFLSSVMCCLLFWMEFATFVKKCQMREKMRIFSMSGSCVMCS